MEIILIALLTVGHAYQMILNILQSRSANNPTPQNVADVYDAETYTRWKSYNAEKSRLNIISTALSFVIVLVLLITDAYSAVAQILPASIFTQMIALLLFDSILTSLLNVGFKYVETMKIEQKYGFNRSTVKTFVLDQIRSLIISIILALLLGFAYIALGIALGIAQPFVSMMMSAYSRHAEYRADRQAVKEGYGEALISGLKMLAKENFADLSPNRAIVILEYSHPPLSERITAIENELEKKI